VSPATRRIARMPPWIQNQSVRADDVDLLRFYGAVPRIPL